MKSLSLKGLRFLRSFFGFSALIGFIFFLLGLFTNFFIGREWLVFLVIVFTAVCVGLCAFFGDEVKERIKEMEGEKYGEE